MDQQPSNELSEHYLKNKRSFDILVSLKSRCSDFTTKIQVMLLESVDFSQLKKEKKKNLWAHIILFIIT